MNISRSHAAAAQIENRKEKDRQRPPKQSLTERFSTKRIKHVTCTSSHLAGLVRYPRMRQRCQTCQSTFSGAHIMNNNLFSVLNAAGDGGIGTIEMLGSARRSGCGSDSVVETLDHQPRYCKDTGNAFPPPQKKKKKTTLAGD